MHAAAVAARGWGWRHGTRRSWAVDGVDLDIGAGERVLVLGASGSGKSTLLNGLAGLLGGDDEGDSRGELLVAGEAPEAARGRVGLVSQDPDSGIVLARVGDDVAFGCENLGVPRDEIWSRVRDSLDAVGLDVPLDHPTDRLSGGQKQRLALAGVLAMRPRVLVLDEPTANLDPAGVREVRDAVDRVIAATGATLVVVEHRVAVWRDVVDRVVVLDAGRVVADGAPDLVLDRHGARLAELGVWVPGRSPVGSELARPAGLPGSAPESAGARDDARVLIARDLGVGRSRSRAVQWALDLEVRAARSLALTGANGSGKSTLALTLGGLLAPIAGSLRAQPRLAAGAALEPVRWSSRELVDRIGTVFQNPEHQFLTTTVRDELALAPRGRRRLSTAVDPARVDELLSRLRLSHLAEANPFTLSGGEKRRLSVATALVRRPGVLVLDEPTFGQDSRTWRELVGLLQAVRDEGAAIVVATHDAELVDALADDVLELRRQAVRA